MPITSTDFHSKPLIAAIEAASEAIEKHDKIRNHISYDIKTLEKYLQSKNLKSTHCVKFGKFVNADEAEVRFALHSLGASVEIHEEALIWKKDSKDQYRLFHELSIWDGSINLDGAPGGPLYHDETTLFRKVRPLIETPFDVRKFMHPRLPEFVNSLRKHLSVNEDAKDH